MNTQKIIIVLFLLTFKITNAQFGFNLKKKAEEVKKIENTTLLVVLKDIDDKTIKRELKKKDRDSLSKHVENFNATLKKSFEDDWTFTKEIKFINKSELKAFLKGKNKNKYSYFISTKKGKTVKNLAKDNIIHYEIFLASKKVPIFSYIYDEFPMTNADFRFIIQQAQQIFEGVIKYTALDKVNRKMRKEGIAKHEEITNQLFKSKILLLNSDDLSKKTIEKLKDIYPYKFRITDKSEIDKVIMEKNTDYLYLKVIYLAQLDNIRTIKSKNLELDSVIGRYSIRVFNPKDGSQVFVSSLTSSKIVGLSVIKSIVKKIK